MASLCWSAWSLLLTLEKWLVITRNVGVIDPFLIRVRLGDSRYTNVWKGFSS